MNTLYRLLTLITLHVASISHSLFAQDTVDLSLLLTNLEPQSAYTVSIPYVASVERDVVVEFWKASTWLQASRVTVPAGSDTASLTLNLGSLPIDGTDYLWKSSIRPVGASWQENIDADSVTGVVIDSGDGGDEVSNTGAWLENGGLVVIEPENGELHADWLVEPSTNLSDPSMAGSLGDGWIEWQGAQVFNTTLDDAAANGVSTFRFVIETEGVYTFRWRTKQHNAGQAGDQGNDTYVKFETGTPQVMTGSKGSSFTLTKFTKVWIQEKNSWPWNTNFEPIHAEFVYSPKVYYTPGTHEIKLAGRSRGHAIDRIVLHHSSVTFNTTNFESAPESERSDAISTDLVYDANDLEDFPSVTGGSVNYYDNAQYDVLAITPSATRYDDSVFARATGTFRGASSEYDVTITTMTEEDGECTYRLLINGSVVASYQNPREHTAGYLGDLELHNHTWTGITVNNGDTIAIESNAHSNDTYPETNGANDFAWARGRWQQIEFVETTLAPLPSAAENTPAAGQYGETDDDGHFKKWHKVTLAFEGPTTSEGATPNPFTDYRLNVTFTHRVSGKNYTVPGYYAADGYAGESSASAGNIWRVHFAPDEIGTWDYITSFRTGTNVAVAESATAGTATSFNASRGAFDVVASDKTGRDHRGKGRLVYDGSRYLKFTETGEPFLKTGADAPENFLNYLDFDNTYNHGGTDHRKSWSPHIQDWGSGDPTWQENKGKGIIGAVNYLASEGQNVFSFLTYNAGGDSKDVWPYVSHTDPLRFDCSKLDQWEIIFSHGDKMGMYLHFKTQETENDDLNGPGAAFALDDGSVGTERKLYYRELIARFGHHLALNWNLGEETTQTTAQHQEMAQYFHDNDPYGHNVVLHTYPDQQAQRYRPLLGSNSELTGVSIQTNYANVHAHTLQWLSESAAAGKQWVAANDEQGSANLANPPDDGYPGYSGGTTPSQKDMRWKTVWGNFMAGGAGIELYAGYQNVQSDLTMDDFRSRDRMWDYCRHAHTFFTEHLPFDQMVSSNALVGNTSNSNSKYCFAKTGEVYAIYLPNGGRSDIDLSAASGTYTVQWFNPRDGGPLQSGTVETVHAGSTVSIGNPPSETSEDWAVLISRSGPDPDVSITTPTNASEVVEGTPVTFRVDISDNPNFDRVEFYLNGDWIDTKEEVPFEITLSDLPIGVHNLCAIEYDSSGNSTMDSVGIGVVETLGEVTNDFDAAEDVFIQGTTVINDNFLKIQTSGPSRVGYLKFDVSGIPITDTIKSATLTIQENGDTGSGTLRLYRGSSTTWTEATITSANAPITQDEVGNYTGSVTAAQSLTIDVTPLVTGNGTYTVIIQLDSGGNDSWFGSSESARAPHLTVVHGEDSPASAPLMNSAVITDVMMLTWWPTDSILESTADLAANDWQPVADSSYPYHVEFLDPHRFYRVRE
ncbi:MAG: DUF5060 domain-containing protein [Opitutaceae bacterium]